MNNYNEYILKNTSILDVNNGNINDNLDIYIKDGLIKSIGKNLNKNINVECIDLLGNLIIPGLIECHAHICSFGMTEYPKSLPSLNTAYAIKELEEMLMRGFTTLRDAGGADYGYKLAINKKLINGPRLFISGAPISQTGGHGDNRQIGENTINCPCSINANMFVVADGVDSVRLAAREQIRKQVDHIKIMGSWGVASPSDTIESIQFTFDEIKAVVDEAKRFNKYVLCHAYNPTSIVNAVTAGVRTIEHGNLIDDDSASIMKKTKSFLVPTLITYSKIVKEGAKNGLPEYHIQKGKEVEKYGLKSLDIAKHYGIKMGFGTDLFKNPSHYQNEEFLIRSEVLTNLEIIQSATIINAEIVNLKNKIGQIKENFIADYIVLKESPIDDINILNSPDNEFLIIAKDGVIVKNILK